MSSNQTTKTMQPRVQLHGRLLLPPVWSMPHAIGKFARALGLSKRQLRTILAIGSIRSRRLLRGLYQLDLMDLPPAMREEFGASKDTLGPVRARSEQDLGGDETRRPQAA